MHGKHPSHRSREGATSSSSSSSSGGGDSSTRSKGLERSDMTSESPNGVPATEKDTIEDHERRGTLQTASDSEPEDDPYLGHDSLRIARAHTHSLGILHMRSQDDTDPSDWWFASTAIPLIAATFAPMANMLSIAALVVYWRNNVRTPDDPTTYYSESRGYEDPRWCTYLNAASLACGFIGNLFLLFNFTKRVRYIIALPVTIIFFYIASGILIGIIVSMARYDPPGPNQVYSQGFWHAVIAACLYMLNSMILMINMWGYFLGHYPQNFTLNDEHRSLIMQTMLFFLWLAGGAGVFARQEQWEYPDALYFCDVTILTIGFGDYFAEDDVGRGLVFPYSVGGTIILGLMVSSIHKFARELSKDNVVRKHVETRRVNTLSRAVTMQDLDDNRLKKLASGQRLSISRPLERDTDRIQNDLNELAHQERLKRRVIGFQDANKADYLSDEPTPESDPTAEPLPSQFFQSKHHGGVIHNTFRTLTFPIVKPVAMTTDRIRRTTSRRQKKILMLQERDRFNAMRQIQTNASTFNRYYALGVSIICFGMLWCLGAMVFYFVEAYTQHLNYFQALYFCYVSLLTIGYGDLSPKSNAGKAFFVLWSLIAVPTMTILVSDLGDTVIGGFKRGVLKNDLGLTSKGGNKEYRSWWKRAFSSVHLGTKHKKDEKTGDEKEPKEDHSSLKESPELEAGREASHSLEIQPSDQPTPQPHRTIEELANEEVSEAEMMRRLAFAIRQTADDLKTHPGKQYSYEEWVQFTRLIRFSKFDRAMLRSGEAGAMKQLEYDEATDGIVEWDWLDAKSPMTSEQTEGEWVLDRLCESLLRVFKKSDLVLGGLDAGKVVRHPGIPEDPRREELATAGVFEPFSFGAKSKRHSLSPRLGSPSPVVSRRTSESGARSPDMMGKMSRFIQGDNPADDTPQWSKRAMAKHAEDAWSQPSGERRRSSVDAPRHRRHGPFAHVAHSPVHPHGKRPSG